MAHDDALFQLGMDLAVGSSTAQTEDNGSSADGAHSDRKDYFIERDGVRFAGTHLIIDLFGARRLDDLAHVERTLKRCIEVAGATLLHIHLHHFTPNGGVSGVAVLSESHISIHSWPEASYAALDVFMCGHAEPHRAVDVLREEFAAERVVVTEHRRGAELEHADWQAGSGAGRPRLGLAARAFSDEVDTGSSQENASRQEPGAPIRFNRIGMRSSLRLHEAAPSLRPDSPGRREMRSRVRAWCFRPQTARLQWYASGHSRNRPPTRKESSPWFAGSRKRSIRSGDRG